jgi:hypothetical protein
VFLVLFVIHWAIHQLCPHCSKSHPLQWLHLFCRAVHHLDFPAIHSLFDKEEFQIYKLDLFAIQHVAVLDQ